MHGPKPMSNERRLLTGNPGHRPINTDEPIPPAADYEEIPREVHGNDEAIREWKRLTPMLRSIRQITEADRAAVIALCLEWSRYIEATLRAYPRVVDTKYGERMNPWLAVKRDALTACLKLWPELGLTPSSRSRVRAADGPSTPGGDTFSEFDEVAPPH